MKEDPLHERLRHIPATLEFPSDFDSAVWRKIESQESRASAAAGPSGWSRVLAWLSRPIPALATVLVMLGAGSFAGRAQFREGRAEKLHVAYFKSISPFEVSPSEPKGNHP